MRKLTYIEKNYNIIDKRFEEFMEENDYNYPFDDTIKKYINEFIIYIHYDIIDNITEFESLEDIEAEIFNHLYYNSIALPF